MPVAAPRPIYALVGSDSFAQLQRLAAILKMLPGAQRADLDGERAELADLLDELRSFAMFGGNKVVVLQNADAFLTRFREQMEDYAANPSSNATLILRLSSLPSNQRIYKAIAKVGQIDDCEAPKDLASWIVQHGRSAHQLTVSPDAARLLADLIGSDLGRLDSELAKLALTANSGRVGIDEITAGVSFQREREMSEMTNALAAGRTADALKRWRQLVQTDSSAQFRAVAWLAIWLSNVRKALSMKKSGMNPFAIAQALRLWPREMQQPFFQTAASMGETGTARAIDLLADIDRQNKSGVGDPATNIERFIISLASR